MSNAISIIIPVLNGERYIADAIRSALGQDCDRPIEVIVVDDGSTDETAKVAADFNAVCVIRQANAGVAAARNRGLDACSGQYLVFLDHDDLLVPGSVGLNASILERDSRLGAVAGGVISFQEKADLPTLELNNSDVKQGLLEFRTHHDILNGKTFRTPGMCMFRREIVDDLGGFRSFAYAEDLDLYVRVGHRAAIAVHSIPVVFHRRHTADVTNNTALMLETILVVLENLRADFQGNGEDVAAIARAQSHWVSTLRPLLPAKALWAAKEMRLRDAAHAMSVWYRLRSAHMQAASQTRS